MKFNIVTYMILAWSTERGCSERTGAGTNEMAFPDGSQNGRDVVVLTLQFLGWSGTKQQPATKVEKQTASVVMYVDLPKRDWECMRRLLPLHTDS